MDTCPSSEKLMKIPEQKIDILKRALSRLILFTLIVLTLLAVFGNHAATVAAQFEPTAQPGSPILVSTPREDGSIVHVVQPGQTLIGIATAYAISLADLLALNGMNENSFIYVDEELIIRGPYTPTPTALPTETPTPLPPNSAPNPDPPPGHPDTLSTDRGGIRWFSDADRSKPRRSCGRPDAGRDGPGDAGAGSNCRCICFPGGAAGRRADPPEVMTGEKDLYLHADCVDPDQ